MERTSPRSRHRPLAVAIGVVLVAVGLLWAGQGFGWIGGSAMSGVTFWAVVGPVVALVGAALVWSGLRARRR